MFLKLLILVLSMNVQADVAVEVAGDPAAPQLKYILDQPQVKADLLEVNRGCLARKNTAICDCFMKNFKFKVNGRDITENDLKMAIDISYRRHEKDYKKVEIYFPIKEMMLSIEKSCANDTKWEMDLDGDVLPEMLAPKNGKSPASVVAPKK